jgi:hypothetical protein
MVKLALATLVALASTAHAEPAEQERAIFGYRLGAGMLPIDHQGTATIYLGLSAEHPIAPRWRVFGEYEWVWLFRTKTDAMPDERGDGQRAHVGVRRRMLATSSHELSWYLDGELGAGFMLANDNMTGVHALPDALAGVRLGWDLHAQTRSRSTSSMLVCELVVRALAVPEGAGMMGGIGVSWQ